MFVKVSFTALLTVIKFVETFGSFRIRIRVCKISELVPNPKHC